MQKGGFRTEDSEQEEDESEPSSLCGSPNREARHMIQDRWQVKVAMTGSTNKKIATTVDDLVGNGTKS